MLVIVNSALLIPRIVMPVLTVATGVGVIAAGITVGVIVGTQVSVWTNTQIVLEAPATVILDRFIKSIEVPYFYNVDETMNVFIDSTKQVLEKRFGARFVNILLKNFSSTPNVTSTYTKTLTKSQNIVIPNKSTDGQSAALLMNDHTTTTTTTTTDSSTTTTTTTDSSTTTTTDSSTTTTTITTTTDSSTTTTTDSSTTTTTITTTTDSSTTTTTDSSTTTTTDSSTTTTTTTAITNNASPCEPSNDTTIRSSIITSKLIIYFTVKQSESILVEEIKAALKNLQPPITLWTKCLISSSRPSSYNTTLSKVDPPKKSKEDFISLVNQPSASNELRESVNEQATTALENAGVFNETIITTPPTPPLTTVPNVTQQIG